MSTVPSELEAAANGTTGQEPAWKRDINDKVAAARARRLAAQQGTSAGNPATQGEVIQPGQAASKAARVAAAVAARYAQAPSYSEYLAAEVKTAMLAAAAAQQSADLAYAAAEAAAHQARAIQAAMQEEAETRAIQEETTVRPSAPVIPGPPRVDYAATGIPYHPAAEAQGIIPRQAHRDPDAQQRVAATGMQNAPSSYRPPSIYRLADPMAEEMLAPAMPLPAKLLEFPRELVAARKSRPRHAEGPLRDEGQDEPPLRIFEVEAEAAAEGTELPPAATEWSTIRLDAYPAGYLEDSAPNTVFSSYPSHAHPGLHSSSTRPASQGHNQHSYYALRDESAFLKVASLQDRLMAGVVDVALVGIAFLLFVLVFTACTVHPPTGKPAVIGSAILLTGFYLLYQVLFFSFSSGTPGMMYARIALCTFDDDNPSREAMRKRIFALVLAAMPLGLGFLYALFDEDHLGWHDRMTRMYQRSYK